jgi:uncharacterized protein
VPEGGPPRASKPVNLPIEIAGEDVYPNERKRIEVPVARLATETLLSIPLEVVHGRRPGPTLFLSAALHGDELNGVEIIRQILGRVDCEKLSGTLLAVPIVNVFGFVEQSRYLPDRRDLNRSFPGSNSGSLAARIAHLFMKEVVAHCSYGIDLHTGSNHRSNVPQLRSNLNDPETRRCAEAFGAPVIMHSETRDGSLREAAGKLGVHTLLYEAGEALRFDEEAIRIGVAGILRVMHALGMRASRPKRRQPVVEVERTTWVRPKRSGILRLETELGNRVEKRERLGVVVNAFGDLGCTIDAPHDGIVIGLTRNPLVNQGDGVVHVGRVAERAGAEGNDDD